MATKSYVRAIGVLAGVLAFLIFGFCVTTLKAQSVSTATILGTVTDSSGAAVAGAMITVKNTGTGVTNSTVADSQGRYTMPDLVIGTYEVDVEAPGFKKSAHSGITLTVGSEVVVDASLEIGTIQQTVTVESDVSHVETTSSTVSTLVEQKQLTDLPLNGRNYQSLVALAPGVLPVAAGQGGNQAKYAVGGSRLAGQAYLLDGSDTINFWGNATGSGALGTALGIDSIAEFNLLMNNYSAQYGGAGVVMNATTKSGTNSYHGTVYEFLRNSAIEASNNYLPSAFPLPPTALDRNQFGASIGGPIKKDKAFFFVNYEGFRQHTSTEVLLQTPDLNARGCQVIGLAACQANNGVGNMNIASINGHTIAPPPCNAAGAYPGANPCTAEINIESILSLLPIGTQADNPSTGIANTFGNYLQRGTENYGMARFDYTISDKDSLFMRYVTDTANLFLPQIVPVDPSNERTASTYATIQERRIFSPTLLNTIAMSFNRPNDNFYQYGAAVVSQFGNFANCQTCPANEPNFYFTPAWFRESGSITGVVGTAAQSLAPPVTSTGFVGAAGVTPFYYVPNHFTFADDVVWTKGAHSLKMGISIQRLRDNTRAPFTNNGAWTPSPVAGTSGQLAGFLSGQMSSATAILPDNLLLQAGLAPPDNVNDAREWIYAPYFQDDWKVSNRLTLNLGVRYSPTNRVGEVRHIDGNILNAPFPGTYGSFVTSTVSGGTSATVGPYPAGTDCLNANGQFTNGVPGALLGCGWVPVPTAVAKNLSLKNIDPRVGVAWDPFSDHKTSVRAGFGLFHTVLTSRDFDYWDNPPTNIIAVQPLSPGLAGGPFGYPFIFATPVGGNCVSTTNPPWQNCAKAGPGVYYGESKTPYTMQWTLSIERQILPETILQVTYVGSRGVDLEGTYNFNSAQACGGTDAATGQAKFTPPGNPFVNGAYVPCQLLNPSYGTFSFTNAMYDSWYQGGTVSLNRRFSHGLQAQLGYTWSKAIDNASATYGGEVSLGGGNQTGSPDPYNLGLGKGLSAWDRANNLRLSGIYELPFNKNMLVAGWQIDAIYTFLSGQPFNVAGLAQGTTAGTAPNLVPGCNPYTGASPQQAVNTIQTGSQAGMVTNPYINAACFSLQPVGEYGNVGRNVLIGPTAWNIDMSIIKDTHITKVSEQFDIQFRAEFFNVLNHPYWAQPNGPNATSASLTGLSLWTYNSTGGINTAGTNLQPGGVTAGFGSFGQPASTPRQIQFGLKIIF